MKLTQAKIFKLIAINVAVVCCFSGCSLFDFIQRKATQGSLPATEWHIEKIVFFSEDDEENGEEFFSPQMLAHNAKESLKNAQKSSQNPKENSTDSNSTDSNESNASSESGNANNSANGNAQPTPLNELAQIDKFATMDFDTKENRISGDSGCGSYYARYSWSNKSHLEIIPGSATRKICTPREVTRFEFRFVRGLEGEFEITQKDEKRLTLKGEKMTIYLYR